MALGNIDQLIKSTTKSSKTQDKKNPARNGSRKVRKTYFIEEGLVESVRVQAFHQRTSVSQIVNAALRQHLKK